jgi:hypothetical protein
LWSGCRTALNHQHSWHTGVLPKHRHMLLSTAPGSGGNSLTAASRRSAANTVDEDASEVRVSPSYAAGAVAFFPSDSGDTVGRQAMQYPGMTLIESYIQDSKAAQPAAWCCCCHWVFLCFVDFSILLMRPGASAAAGSRGGSRHARPHLRRHEAVLPHQADRGLAVEPGKDYSKVWTSSAIAQSCCIMYAHRH